MVPQYSSSVIIIPEGTIQTIMGAWRVLQPSSEIRVWFGTPIHPEIEKAGLLISADSWLEPFGVHKSITHIYAPKTTTLHIVR